MAFERVKVKRYGNRYSERSMGFYERNSRYFFYALLCYFFIVLSVRYTKLIKYVINYDINFTQ